MTRLPAPSLPAATLGLSLALALAADAPLAAQTTGRITYTHTVKIELPPEMAAFRNRMPSSREQVMRVSFTPDGSVSVLERPEGRGQFGVLRGRRGGGPPGDRADMARVAEARRAMEVMVATGGGPRGAAGARPGGPGMNLGPPASAWISFADGAMVESREFLGRTFRVSATVDLPEWRMTSEQAVHEGHMVMKATAELDGSELEAWFAPQIPVQGGPAAYGGLPGMILVLSVDDGREQYFATEISLGEIEEGVVEPPEEGDEMTMEEFREMVEEKTAEMMRTRRRGGDDG